LDTTGCYTTILKATLLDFSSKSKGAVHSVVDQYFHPNLTLALLIKSEVTLLQNLSLENRNLKNLNKLSRGISYTFRWLIKNQDFPISHIYLEQENV
jgi:hypothetical protein